MAGGQTEFEIRSVRVRCAVWQVNLQEASAEAFVTKLGHARGQAVEKGDNSIYFCHAILR